MLRWHLFFGLTARRFSAPFTLICVVCVVCLLVAADRAVLAEMDMGPRPVADGTDLGCGRLPASQPRVYRNRQFGLTMTYPAGFTLDPDSIPDTGDTTRFWTPDRQATAVITALRNGLGQSLADLFDEAKRDVTQNSGGEITYTRIKDNWFVISGYMAGRIFYRRTVLVTGSRVIGNLWIEFPRNMRPCFEGAVTMMSLSFRPIAP